MYVERYPRSTFTLPSFQPELKFVCVQSVNWKHLRTTRILKESQNRLVAETFKAKGRPQTRQNNNPTYLEPWNVFTLKPSLLYARLKKMQMCLDYS